MGTLMDELRVGRDRLGDPAWATNREWLVTNGIGGYASGTVSGVLSRRYHGLLFAALEPPLGRTLLLAKLGERIELDGVWLDLDTNLWASGSLAPQGYRHLESFRLEDSVPVWTWAIGDTRLEKRVWMEHGENTTHVEYRLVAAHAAVRLALRALVNRRDHHLLTSPGVERAEIDPTPDGMRVLLAPGPPLWLSAPGADLIPAQQWHRQFALAREAERGLDHVEDHLFAGELVAVLAAGESLTVTAGTRAATATGPPRALALAAARSRRAAHDRALLDAWRQAHRAAARTAPAWVRRLVLAADAFVVERPSPRDPLGRSIIAGYPWFSDWGRDTMIALPGLALATGRPEVAKAVLATHARHEDRGMLPNRFLDHGEAPDYHTADAGLWFFQAVRAYHDATADDAFLAEVFSVLEDIGAWYERGTRFGIGVDPRDGLVTQGEDGVQLTWMDAKVDDRVVTPRRGKPVEINALWYNALMTMTDLARRLRRPTDAFATLARRVENSFERFWNHELGCLYDVIDGPRGPDPAIRPNQIFAVSLPDSPLSPPRRRSVVETCGRWLLTSHGLRSLAPNDPAYRGRYAGDPAARDGAYHQGTAWTWLLPHYALAHFRVYRDRQRALALLEPLGDLLSNYGIGSLPEVTDGDAPYAPKGCIAQAWSVGETLRVWHLLSERRSAPRKARQKQVEATV
ncbi:MAG TPA: amylo-alpha-1,6-glucosidase [Candidatus Limnocylindria bacterium]|nr:amylo-alpha-1,6-glucosidase [Candidatus Limnocylindria bacterium]